MRTRTLLVALIAISWFVVGIAVLGGLASGDVSVTLLMLVGMFTAMVALWSVVRRRSTQRRFDVPRVELGRSIPVPGTDLEDAIGEFHERGSGAGSLGRRAAAGLYGLSMAVLTRFRGLTEDEATGVLDTGSWTSDPYAAGLLSPTLSVPYPESAVRKRLLRYASSIPTVTIRNHVIRLIETESRYAIAIKRTAVEVSRVSDEARGSTMSLPETDRIEAATDRSVVRTTDRPVDDAVEAGHHQTAYWNGIGVVALLSVTVGLYAREPAAVLIGVVAIAFAGLASITRAPTPSLSVSRSLSVEHPEPGDPVTVTVSLENDSEAALLDIRYVDGVPPALSVVEGRARIGTALGSGESTSFEYTLEAGRGRHEFDPGLVVTRDLFQSEERATYVPSNTTIVSEPASNPLATAPALRRLAGTFGSSFTTSDSGDGTAFHSVREYRRGDPLNRIDWNRRARTGDLATLEFQTEYAGSVLLLVDARKAAYVAPERGVPHAVDRAVAACSRIAPTLREGGNHVGLAAIGPTIRAGTGGSTAGACWIQPHAGRTHEQRLLEALSTHPQLSSTVPTGAAQWRSQLRDLRRRLPSNTQVLYVTPLADAVSVEIPRRLEASGHAVSVLSPDATETGTTSQRLARVARLIRRFDLQRSGIPVVQWGANETIEQALAGDIGTVGSSHRESPPSSDGDEPVSKSGDERSGDAEPAPRAPPESAAGDRS